MPRHRLTPALARHRTFLCEPCQVTWTGDEADCWSCGKPATASVTRRRARRALLAPARPTRYLRRRKGAVR